jgi:hypothetical protein
MTTLIDAVVKWNDKKAYFFKNSQYVRYDIAADKADSGYPEDIKSHWSGLDAFASGIDAVVNWATGKAYFFKGSQYIRYDIAADKADPGYPKDIKGNWSGLDAFANGIDAVENWGNGKAYFFKGSQYIRYDIAADKADPGYPKDIDSNWILGMSQSFNYFVNDVPDIDQQWSNLPNNGAMYCVPTSTLNWLYYFALHGCPQALAYQIPKTPEAAFNTFTTLNLGMLASYMDTDPKEGTTGSGWFDGLMDWLNDRQVPAMVRMYTYSDDTKITFDILKEWANFMLLLGGKMCIAVGRYEIKNGCYERNGGHALTVVGLNQADDNYSIKVHDPNDDNSDLKTQSATKTPTIALNHEWGNFEGKKTTLLRWGTSIKPYQFIDYVVVIQPYFVVTNLSVNGANKLAYYYYNLDSDTTTLQTKEITLPFSAELLDLAIHPALPIAVCIAKGTNEVWSIDLVNSTSKQLATLDSPQRLTYGGRSHRLFVASAHQVVTLDNDGKVVDRLELAQPVDALSFDYKLNRLVIASDAVKKLLFLNPTLQIQEEHELPAIAGNGRISLTINEGNGTLYATRNGSSQVVSLRIHPTGAIARGLSTLLSEGETSAVHVNHKDMLYVSENGRIATFDSDGNRVPSSPFEGLPAGSLLQVSRSHHNFDPELMQKPEWRND